MIICDFDNTLYDTETLKELFYNIITVHNIDLEEAKKIYKISRDSDGIKASLNLDNFILKVRENLKNKDKELNKTEVDKIIKEINRRKLVLPDANGLLRKLRKKERKMILLSLGEEEFQKHKLKKSGLERFFDEVVITDDVNQGKIIEIKRILNGEELDILFFNDKPDETDLILQKFPNLRAIVRRELRDERYCNEDFEELSNKHNGRVDIVTNLKDAIKLI
jgi:phosphoglycolate phosphatase-like HAD superfamily hydrolase